MKSGLLGAVIILNMLAMGAAAQSSFGPGSSLPTAPSPAQSVNERQNVYLGSRSHEALHPDVLELSIQDALDRGLKTNLGLFLSSTAADRAGAARRKEMSELLPHLEGTVRESAQRINLRGLGIPLSSLPRTVDVGNSDARVDLSQSVLDLTSIARTRAAGSSENAAHSDYRNAREIVAAAVSDVYLSVLSAQARLDFANADLRTADALYELAKDREKSGLNPEVDTLRAQVEQQSRQQSVIEASNALDKERIVLLRLLGLDIHQSIHLTSTLQENLAPSITSETAYQQALEYREDYRSARQQLKSAELAKQAAELERAPKIGLGVSYGALGTVPGNMVDTWNAGIALRIPVFQGGRIEADVSDADAALRQKQAELEDIRTRIAQEVENALLDLDAAQKQVQVSQAALRYAKRALTQSRDRFSAGVTNNIEVIQAQEALVNANEQWVNSMYAYSVAKISLARATGTAETSARGLLPSQSSAKQRP